MPLRDLSKILIIYFTEIPQRMHSPIFLEIESSRALSFKDFFWELHQAFLCETMQLVHSAPIPRLVVLTCARAIVDRSIDHSGCSMRVWVVADDARDPQRQQATGKLVKSDKNSSIEMNCPNRTAEMADWLTRHCRGLPNATPRGFSQMGPQMDPK